METQPHRDLSMFRALRNFLFRSTPEKGRDRHRIVTCPDCGAADGQLHELFCLKERCPFCGGQLAGCPCVGRVLNLTTEEQRLLDEYVDDSIPPLSTIMERWKDALERKGRVPFASYPDNPYRAAYCGNLQAVRDFLDDGCDVGSVNEVGYTILMAAARGGDLEMLRLLLARGAKADFSDTRGYTALHWIVAQSVSNSAGQVAGIRLLIAAGADPNSRSQDGTTPLMNAAWFGCADAVRELLRQGAKPAAMDNKERTARSLALERNHAAVAELLG